MEHLPFAALIKNVVTRVRFHGIALGSGVCQIPDNVIGLDRSKESCSRDPNLSHFP